MKQRVVLKTYTRDTRNLYKRFAKGLLWHWYGGAEDGAKALIEARMTLLVEAIRRYQLIIDKHTYTAKLKDFDPGEPSLKSIKISHPDQLNIVFYFELYDRALFLLEFLWINALVLDAFHSAQQRKLHNTFTDTAAKLLAMSANQRVAAENKGTQLEIQ